MKTIQTLPPTLGNDSEGRIPPNELSPPMKMKAGLSALNRVSDTLF